MINKKYKSKLEEYFFEKDYEKFNVNLRKFIGYITRRYFSGFQQTSERYEELRDRAVVAIYDKLISGKFDALRGDFRSYLYTQIRGELTKYFNKFNRERKFQSLQNCVDILFCNDENDKNYNQFSNIIEKIIKQYDLEISTQTVLSYLLNHNKIIKNSVCDYEIKLIFWIFFSKYIGGMNETYFI